jgi:hypothetical protein
MRGGNDDTNLREGVGGVQRKVQLMVMGQSDGGIGGRKAISVGDVTAEDVEDGNVDTVRIREWNSLTMEKT